jgi:hypothetical protein
LFFSYEDYYPANKSKEDGYLAHADGNHGKKKIKPDE